MCPKTFGVKSCTFSTINISQGSSRVKCTRRNHNKATRCCVIACDDNGKHFPLKCQQVLCWSCYCNDTSHRCEAISIIYEECGMRTSKNTTKLWLEIVCRILEPIFLPPTISRVMSKKFISVLEKACCKCSRQFVITFFFETRGACFYMRDNVFAAATVALLQKKKKP